MKIGVIGGGVVGRATARTWLGHCDEVRVHDRLKERSLHTLAETLNCDLVFVCLPTPQKPDSLEMDVSAVEGFFSIHQVGWQKLSDVNFVLRSTVPIGMTRRLVMQHDLPNLVHHPEFLTARCAMADAMTPAQLVVGAEWEYGGSIRKFQDMLLDAIRNRFPGVPIRCVSSDESEAAKLFLNGAFAVKVALFNELRSLADSMGLDWDAVRDAMLGDGRIAHEHTQVPGPDGRRGFGGECLPKDLAQLVHHLVSNKTALQYGGRQSLVSLTAHDANKNHHRKEKS